MKISIVALFALLLLCIGTALFLLRAGRPQPQPAPAEVSLLAPGAERPNA